MRIGVCGCGHGQLDALFSKAASENVELLIIGGDFQAFRSEKDMESASIPHKYRQIGEFRAYYKREKRAPVLTIFVGGNHESMEFASNLRFGGWICPQIYYLGFAGVVWYKGLRIAGLSGIYNKISFNKGHFESFPLDSRQVRSIYHIREFELFELLQLAPTIDIFLSHDWPTSIYYYGDTKQLLKQKPFFRKEVETNTLGNPMTEQILHKIRPRYWFASHLHVEFEAHFPHWKNEWNNADEVSLRDQNLYDDETFFLALDKFGRGKNYFRAIDMKCAESKDQALYRDKDWLAIVKAFEPWYSREYLQKPFPSAEDCERLKLDAENWAYANFTTSESLVVPKPDDWFQICFENYENFINSQTKTFCALLEIDTVN